MKKDANYNYTIVSARLELACTAMLSKRYKASVDRASSERLATTIAKADPAYENMVQCLSAHPKLCAGIYELIKRLCRIDMETNEEDYFTKNPDTAILGLLSALDEVDKEMAYDVAPYVVCSKNTHWAKKFAEHILL